MLDKMSVAEWVEAFLLGKFDALDVDTQCAAGWYDWFCRDTSLANKTQKLGRLVVQLMKSKRFDPKTTYVFFKNNCPANKPGTYDSLSICKLEDGHVLFWITPKCGHSGLAEVWDMSVTQKEATVTGSWKDVKAYMLAK